MRIPKTIQSVKADRTAIKRAFRIVHVLSMVKKLQDISEDDGAVVVVFWQSR